MHSPISPFDAEALRRDALSCAFATGGPKVYLGGLNCISRRLNRSKYPLLTFVNPEEEQYMRARLPTNAHPHSRVLSWVHFPAVATTATGLRGGQVLDKLNVFGLPVKRIVWVDADMLIKHDIDELCELPDDIKFASSLNNANGRPTYCFSNDARHHRDACHLPEMAHCIGAYNVSMDSGDYTFLRVAEMRPPAFQCPFIIQSGIMVLSPLGEAAFNEQLVRPIVAGAVHSYDGTDQGLISTLIYGSQRLFGEDGFARLHPKFNVIFRNARHTEMNWCKPKVNATGLDCLTTMIWHFTGLTPGGRPWLQRYDNKTPPQTYHRLCPYYSDSFDY